MSKRIYFFKLVSVAFLWLAHINTMPPDDYMSDDFVANLVAKDAKESTIKYSALGLQALLPRRSIVLPITGCDGWLIYFQTYYKCA